jgi:hypothetical protein
MVISVGVPAKGTQSSGFGDRGYWAGYLSRQGDGDSLKLTRAGENWGRGKDTKKPKPAANLYKKRNPAASRCKKCTTKGKCAAHAKAADFGHDKRPAKYKGLRRDAFGYPARWMYPLNTPQRTRAAARFYGQYCDRYPPAMRKELARNIDKAEKRHGIGKYERKRNPKARRRAPRAG